MVEGQTAEGGMTDKDEIDKAMAERFTQSNDVHVDKRACGHSLIRCVACDSYELKFQHAMVHSRHQGDVLTTVVERGNINHYLNVAHINGDDGCGVVFKCESCGQVAKLEFVIHEGGGTNLGWHMKKRAN
jgi:hypothetical protein